MLRKLIPASALFLLANTGGCTIDPPPGTATAADTGVQVITGETKTPAGSGSTMSEAPPPPNPDGSTTVMVTDSGMGSPAYVPSTPPVITSPFVLPPVSPPPSPDVITIPDPAPAPTTSTSVPVGCASLTNPAWGANGPVNLPDTVCVATQSCESLLKSGSTDPNATFPSLVAGKRYYVTPRTDGVTLPDGVSGPAVVAVPADGSIPTTMDQVFAASCFQ